MRAKVPDSSSRSRVPATMAAGTLLLLLPLSCLRVFNLLGQSAAEADQRASQQWLLLLLQPGVLQRLGC